VCPCELKTGGPYAFINGVGSDFDFGGLCGVALAGFLPESLAIFVKSCYNEHNEQVA
jgi:hypothetical protein